MNRVDLAKFVCLNAVYDFFGGWGVDDIEYLESKKPKILPEPNEGEIVDWLGIRTNANFHGWLNMPSDKKLSIPQIPIPDDSVHAEAIEYIAMFKSLDLALSRKQSSYTVIELGSSYGPWAVASSVTARRFGIEEVNLIGVEASKKMSLSMWDHCRLNGLINGVDKCQIKIINGAVSASNEPLYFPIVDVTVDNGAQITKSSLSTDYRGVKVEHEKISAYTLSDIFGGIARVDFLHIDIQGAEEELLQSQDFLNCITNKVSVLYLATQSRLIEGIALKILGGADMSLIRERPTIFQQNTRALDVNGWTTRDGGQIWINKRFM